MSHLISLKDQQFVLWRPGSAQPPRLVIGVFQPGNPPQLGNRTEQDFVPHPQHGDLWVLPVNQLPPGTLQNGQVYHYFIQVRDTSPYKDPQRDILCTDPTAYAVDWRLRAPSAGPNYGDDDRDPAAIILYQNGKLAICDAGGEQPEWGNDAQAIRNLAPNNRTVIYELPTSWTRRGEQGGKEVDIGSFQDVRALVEVSANPVNFAGVAALEGRAHLAELGINVLELLPPADSFVNREWGYATSNYLGADYDLGRPVEHSWSTATTDLVALVRSCHDQGIRFFTDMVMGFGRHTPTENVNFLDFHVRETGNPAQVDPEKDNRHNWEGALFKYGYASYGYDPLTGLDRPLYPARQYMKLQMSHWVDFYHVDGIRIDSVKTVYNWDFIGEFTREARQIWRSRCSAVGLSAAEADGRFLVVGEILDDGEEPELVRQRRADGVWNDSFKRRVRQAILGHSQGSDWSFEDTVRKMIDCRNLGYSDLAQVVNYVGSHDVEGFQNERLYDFLVNNGIYFTEGRIKLAFVCLMTANGIPMILAGDEFAEHSDLMTVHPDKQKDTVNFERLDDPWRHRIFEYVARLVQVRTSCPALAVTDTEFIHADFYAGRRVLAWRRGVAGSPDQVVVVANFSSWGTENPFDPRSEYVVGRWPRAPAGRRWREVTQARDVPPEWVGREPVFPWEAKVYQTVPL